jgi:hypothetical protein
MKKFAHWTNTAIVLKGGDGQKTLLEDAEQFMVDIPDATSREDVICKLALEYGTTINDADGLEFQEEWPREIQKQFDSLEANSEMILRWGR